MTLFWSKLFYKCTVMTLFKHNIQPKCATITLFPHMPLFRHQRVIDPGLFKPNVFSGLEELKRACSGFIQCCVTVDTVCALLATAERYIQYKCTKALVQKVIIIIHLSKIRYIDYNLNIL